MKLLIIRHAVAQDRAEFAATGQPDEERPLTEAGRKKMKRAARGLAEWVAAVDMIACSPLKRARETAEILADVFGAAALSVTEVLEPDHSFEEFLEWLRGLADVEVAAVIGHEPHLSELTGWLLTGEHKALFEFKKGGTCLLQFDDVLEPGAARLHWLLTPAQLRALKD